MNDGRVGERLKPAVGLSTHATKNTFRACCNLSRKLRHRDEACVNPCASREMATISVVRQPQSFGMVALRCGGRVRLLRRTGAPTTAPPAKSMRSDALYRARSYSSLEPACPSWPPVRRCSGCGQTLESCYSTLPAGCDAQPEKRCSSPKDRSRADKPALVSAGSLFTESPDTAPAKYPRSS
jgi:hypothetical protein